MKTAPTRVSGVIVRKQITAGQPVSGNDLHRVMDLNRRGVALRRERNFVGAVAQFAAALAIARDHRTLLQLGITEREMGRPTEAIATLREAIAHYPHAGCFVAGYFELALTTLSLQMRREAFADLQIAEKTATHDDRQHPLWRRLCEILRELKPRDSVEAVRTANLGEHYAVRRGLHAKRSRQMGITWRGRY